MLGVMGAPVGLTLPGSPEVSPAGAVKLHADVHWLSVSTSTIAALGKRAMLVSMIAPALILAYLAFLWYIFGAETMENPRVLLRMLVLGIVLAVNLVLIPFLPRIIRRRFEKYRLGASRAGLHFELGQPRRAFGPRTEGVVPWADVSHDGRRLLAGKTILPLRSRQGLELFDAEALRTNILAHIPRDNHVTPTQLALRQARKYSWLLILVALAIVIWFALARTL
jgi:hypothetical protein